MADDYLTVADVLGLHAVLMKHHGGAPGIRDPGALEAALFHPHTGYYEDIVMEAAALMESHATNHPFVDGNKRIAFAAADVFLRINGWRLLRAPMQIHAKMIGCSKSKRLIPNTFCHGCKASQSSPNDSLENTAGWRYVFL